MNTPTAATSLASASSSRLRTIAPGNATNFDVDVVAIPGIGTPKVEEWPIARANWLNSFHQSPVPRARVMAFEYDISFDEGFSLRSLLYMGSELLASLLEMRSTSAVRCISPRRSRAVELIESFLKAAKRPLIFFCHSFGGIILKQALCVASQQLYRFYTLLSAVSGIVFMGTPHANINRGKGDDVLSLILKAGGKSTKKVDKVDELSLMDGLSSRFEGVHLRVPILSAYENKETKIKKGRFRNQRLILVDRQSATISAPLETLLDLPQNHLDICQLQDEAGVVNSMVNEFVRGILLNAQKTAQEKLQLLHPLSVAAPSLALELRSAWSVDENEPDQTRERERQKSSVSRDTGNTGKGTGVTSTFSYDLIPMVSSFVPPKRTVKLPCYLLEPHAQNPYFSGREEILKLLEAGLVPVDNKLVSSAVGQLKQFAICGLGGIGKTELAIEFAFTHMDKFDAIFCVPSDDVSKLDATFSQIALELGLEDLTQTRNHVVSRELVKGWLSNPSKNAIGSGDYPSQEDANWLLIFDNVDDPDILADYWPVGGSGSILITSRNPLAKTAHSMEAANIDLDPFTVDEATMLLQKLTRLTSEQDVARKVSQVLGGLPLAISQMANIIRYQYLSYSEFLERYEDEAERCELHELNIKQASSSYGRTLASVWALDALTPEARSLLNVTAFLDPDCIQERLLAGGRQEGGLPMYPDRPATFAAARARLIHGSLIKRNAETREIWVHRLIQDVCKARMSDEDFPIALQHAVALLISVWPPLDVANKHVTARWQQCQELFPHVLTLMREYKKLFDAGAIEPHIGFATLCNDAGWWQHEIGMSHNVGGLFDMALKIAKTKPEEEVQTLLVDIYHSLGAIGNETNNAEACLTNTQIELDMQEKAFKNKPVYDYRQAIVHCQLGIALNMTGEYKKAIAFLLKSIETMKLAHNFSRAMLSVPFTNLGFAYWLNGDLKLASDILERGLQEREEDFGKMDKDSFKCGFLLYALGNVRASQNQLEASFVLHQDALLQYKATLGLNHHRTADACHKVAQHYIRIQQLGPAEILIDQALKIWKTDPKVYRNEIARTSYLKGVLLSIQGKEEESKRLRAEACRLRNEILKRMDGLDDVRESDYDQLVTFWSR